LLKIIIRETVPALREENAGKKKIMFGGGATSLHLQPPSTTLLFSLSSSITTF
jgi:hypothetical protein